MVVFKLDLVGLAGRRSVLAGRAVFLTKKI